MIGSPFRQPDVAWCCDGIFRGEKILGREAPASHLKSGRFPGGEEIKGDGSGKGTAFLWPV